ncbi:hypothetical protein DW886_15120 [Enterocloster aldenensis]|nr:hypothetical protein DW886_15120 [Enterocloster aldenensis]
MAVTSGFLFLNLEIQLILIFTQLLAVKLITQRKILEILFLYMNHFWEKVWMKLHAQRFLNRSWNIGSPPLPTV